MEITPTGKIALSLAYLETFDPRFSTSGMERRFLCPLPKCSGKLNRNLTANTEDGKWRCMRCQASGLLKEFWTEREFIPQAKRRRIDTRKPFALEVATQPQRPIKPVEEWIHRLGEMIPLAGTPGAAYLASRGLDLDVCVSAKVRFAANFCRGGEKQSRGFPAVVFPIIDQSGKTVAAQGRAIEGSRKITFGTKSAGVFATPGAFDAPQLAIVEAPIDALSLACCGVPAVAIGGTDGMPDWLLKERALGGCIIAAFDNDEPGEKAAEKLRQQGRPIAVTVTRKLPPEGFKDWNDALKAMGREALTGHLLGQAKSEHIAIDAATIERMKEAKRAAKAGEIPDPKRSELLSVMGEALDLAREHGDDWPNQNGGLALYRHWDSIAQWWSKTPYKSPLVREIDERFGIDWVEVNGERFA